MQADHILPSDGIPYPLDIPLKAWVGRMTHGISPAALGAALEDWWIHLAASPGKQAELAESAMRKLLQWLLLTHGSLPGTPSESLVPPSQDKRFHPQQWGSPPFNQIAHAFLLTQQWWTEATTHVRGVSRHHQEVTEFMTRQWLDMWSPSNFVATNPQLQQEVLATGGQNLAVGFANWWQDAIAVLTESNPPGAERFKPGETVATTPGKVVFRNRLIELIQYEPTTPGVHPEPVLIVPSWIMKYYILDLSPNDSMVKYLVDKGHTVFMISWKNPDATDRDLRMDDYIELGVLAAIKAVEAIGAKQGIHAVGYCLGGTLLAIVAAALARDERSPLKTLTLLAGQIDFQEPGELGLFIDDSQIAFLEDLTFGPGYLDGRQMAGAFALINSKDLVWSKLVHEYLMGAQTPLNDLHAWNADATRMPHRMHSEYLRRLYLYNDLAEGRYPVGHRPVAIQDIRLPIFVVSTERDHVSPWRSVYKIHLLTDTEISFVLTAGGHNVGIVNPPNGPQAHPAASHRFAMRATGSPYVDPQTWLDTAPILPGSWWTTWQRWLAEHSSKRAAPLPIGGRGGTRLRALANAPGAYVHGV